MIEPFNLLIDIDRYFKLSTRECPACRENNHVHIPLWIMNKSLYVCEVCGWYQFLRSGVARWPKYEINKARHK